jgi:hypothetical protein
MELLPPTGCLTNQVANEEKNICRAGICLTMQNQSFQPGCLQYYLRLPAKMQHTSQLFRSNALASMLLAQGGMCNSIYFLPGLLAILTG